jgi:predicted DNA-binding antitoxin AbrB/MazE fold protein
VRCTKLHKPRILNAWPHIVYSQDCCSQNRSCRLPQRATPELWALELRLYNSGMPLQVDAVYENGVLRPLQPLDLKEHEHVLVSVVQDADRDRSGLSVEYIEKIKRELQDTQPAPGIEEVRRRLAKIPGSMAAEIIAERTVRRSDRKHG